MAEAPNRYDDPYWSQLAAAAEAKNGLPDGLLRAVLLHGERSNNNQVSSASAKTPFQIIPSTRDAFLKKYGVDAYLSPENAAQVGALHLKESLDRNGGNPMIAIAEYNASPTAVKNAIGIARSKGDESQFVNYLPAETRAYVPRTVAGWQTISPAAIQTGAGGESRSGGSPAPQQGEQGWKPQQVPEGVLKAYKEDRMLREHRIALENDVASGLWALPEGMRLGKTEERGALASVKEAVTGAERRTAQTDALQDWAAMPELNQASFRSALAGLGTLAAPTQEIPKIIQAQAPGVKVRQDEKGNVIMRSAVDGKEYAIKPGAQWSDVPRIIGGIAAFAPAARATTVLGSAAGGAATQAAIEGTQAATGGDFNPTDVAAAGVLGGAIPAVGNAVRALRTPAQAVIEQAAPIVSQVNRRGTASSVMDGRRATDPRNVAAAAPEAPAAPVAPVAPATQMPRAADAPTVTNAPPAATARAAANETLSPEDLGALVRTASGDSMGAIKAQEQIAQAAKLNKDAMSAAQRLGIELPADVFSDSQMVREAAGLTRSVAGSTASGAWRDAVQTAARKADEVMGTLDASPNLAAVSEKALGSLNQARTELEQTAKRIYGAVNSTIPATTKVTFPKLTETLAAIRKETPNSLTAQETRLQNLVKSKATTYGDLMREKDSIGKAMAGKDSPYGNMTASALKRLYGALAEDQLNNVGRVGGEAMRTDLRTANQLYAKKAALEKRIINSFGKETEGSISNVMRQAIEQGSKGNVAPLNKLLKVVPPDMQKEAVATALMTAARAKGGAVRGDFGFSEFNKLYTGLRQNEPVYARIVAALGGKDAHNLLSDLNTISKRVTDARANVLTTGKANQALVGAMKAEGLMSGVLGKIPGMMAAGATYATGGGATGAALARNAVNALASGKRDVVESAGKMFSSPEFQKVMTEAATGTPKPETIKRLATSKRFSDFARRVNLPREANARERWIVSVMLGTTEFPEDKK